MRISILVVTALMLTLTACSRNSDHKLDGAISALAKKDYAGALAIIQPLAKDGNAKAQYNLGKMYLDGTGVDRNATEAAKWYRLAADQGNMDAQ